MEHKILNILLKPKMAKEEYCLHQTQLENYTSQVSKMMGYECKKINGTIFGWTVVSAIQTKQVERYR